MVITQKELFEINLSKTKYYISFLLSFIFFVLSLFFINNFLYSFNFNFLIYFLLSFILYAVFTIICILSDNFVFNLMLIFLISGSLFILLFYEFNNSNLFYLPVLYILFLSLAYYLIKHSEQNYLKINWFYLFRIFWNVNAFFILILIFIYLLIYFNPSRVQQSYIENFLSRTKFIFEVLNLGVTPDTKISDIIKNNIQMSLDEKTMNEAIKLSIEEINKKYNLKLTPESTLKEAIAQYVKNYSQVFNENRININKIFLVLILVLLLQSILYILGFISSVVSLIVFYIINKLKLFEIVKEPTYKETIKF